VSVVISMYSSGIELSIDHSRLSRLPCRLIMTIDKQLALNCHCFNVFSRHHENRCLDGPFEGSPGNIDVSLSLQMFIYCHCVNARTLSLRQCFLIVIASMSAKRIFLPKDSRLRETAIETRSVRGNLGVHILYVAIYQAFTVLKTR